MNEEYKKIKSIWAEHAKQLLANHPDKLLEFEHLWNADKVKDAYLYIDSFIRELGIKMSGEFKKADESLYWLLQ